MQGREGGGLRPTSRQERKGRDQEPHQDKKKEIWISQLEALDMCIDIMDMHLATWKVLVEKT